MPHLPYRLRFPSSYRNIAVYFNPSVSGLPTGLNPQRYNSTRLRSNKTFRGFAPYTLGILGVNSVLYGLFPPKGLVPRRKCYTIVLSFVQLVVRHAFANIDRVFQFIGKFTQAGSDSFGWRNPAAVVAPPRLIS